MPADSVAIVGVIHGGATALANADDVSPADLALMRTLAQNGVRFHVCAQSAATAGITLPDDLPDVVTPALSAMTTFLTLGQQGYQRL